MHNQTELETLLKQALKQAMRNRRYFYVSCHLKPALETLQEQKEAKKGVLISGCDIEQIQTARLAAGQFLERVISLNTNASILMY